MHVKIGDVVKMRDGRMVEVTDAPDSLEPLVWIDKYVYQMTGQEFVKDTMPAETIFGGNEFIKNRRAGRVFSDMSEVVAIVN
jgi:hypothetical protein